MNILVLLMTLTRIFAVLALSDGHLNEADKTYLVDSHNTERANQGASNMYKISWNTTLEGKAQSLADSCTYKHTADDVRTWGENMGMIMFPNPEFLEGYSSTNKIDIIIITGIEGLKSWIEEKEYDTKQDFACARSDWKGPTCGHYTQVVWHDSTQIGCGAKNCAEVQRDSGLVSNAWVLVCAYMKPGNMAGEDAFTKGTACDDCSSGDTCEDKLCVAG